MLLTNDRGMIDKLDHLLLMSRGLGEGYRIGTKWFKVEQASCQEKPTLVDYNGLVQLSPHF